METLIAIFFMGGILVPVGAVLSAIYFRAATKWLQKREVPFQDAYLTMLYSGLVNYGFGVLVSFVVGATSQSQDDANAMSLFLLLVGLLIQAGFVRSYLKVSSRRAYVLSLAMGAIGLVAASPLFLEAYLMRP